MRDYKKEYKERAKRGQALGISRNAMRGHPQHGEMGVRELASLVRLASVHPDVDETGKSSGRSELRRRLKKKGKTIEEFIEIGQALGLTKDSSVKLWFGY